MPQLLNHLHYRKNIRDYILVAFIGIEADCRIRETMNNGHHIAFPKCPKPFFIDNT